MEQIKLRIRLLRQQLGMTMAEFAKSIDVSPGNVGDWESTKRPSVPGAQALIAIALTHQISLDWLLLGVGEPSAKHASPSSDNESSYSEYIKPEFAANPQLFQKLIEIALPMSEEELKVLIHSLKEEKDYRIG